MSYTPAVVASDEAAAAPRRRRLLCSCGRYRWSVLHITVALIAAPPSTLILRHQRLLKLPARRLELISWVDATALHRDSAWSPRWLTMAVSPTRLLPEIPLSRPDRWRIASTKTSSSSLQCTLPPRPGPGFLRSNCTTQAGPMQRTMTGLPAFSPYYDSRATGVPHVHRHSSSTGLSHAVHRSMNVADEFSFLQALAHRYWS